MNKVSLFVVGAIVAGCGPGYVRHPPPVAACYPEEGTGLPFDRGEAAAKTNLDVTSCRRPGVEPGSARIEMVFCPTDGAVHSATLIEDPFDDDETRKCVEERFFQVRVPPFRGKPVHVKRAIDLR